MTPRVRTVSGDVAPEELGATDYHEHLFQVSPLRAPERVGRSLGPHQLVDQCAHCYAPSQKVMTASQ